jgi:hypothetical protein
MSFIYLDWLAIVAFTAVMFISPSECLKAFPLVTGVWHFTILDQQQAKTINIILSESSSNFKQ